MKRSTRNLLTIAAMAVLSVSSVVFAASASADHHDKDLSTWAPTSMVSVMTNAGGVDVNYWFKWEGPSSTTNHRWNSGDTVFEFGYKGTGNDGCSSEDGWLGKAGWPANMDIQVDYTEEGDDAVIWMDGVGNLKNHINNNPGSEYSVWWPCSNNNHFDEDTINAYQVALNECDIICEPFTTFTAQAYNYIPAEQAGQSVPNDQFDNRLIQTNLTAPWPKNWNFEDGIANWNTWNASRTSINGNAYQGNKYIYVQPNQSGKGNQTLSRLRQLFDVKTSSTKAPNGYELGNNTNITYEGYFRCPVWAPEWAGRPAGTDCSIQVRWRTVANGNWRVKNYTIPSDWTWYRVYFDADPAQVSDDNLQLFLDTRGFPMDIDAQWVTSGI
jgi:hypothetical protein